MKPLYEAFVVYIRFVFFLFSQRIRCFLLFEQSIFHIVNFYIRYFDNEVLVHDTDAAVEFIRSIDEIKCDDTLEAELREYCNSNVLFPKRYKVRARVYFIVIKTEAQTMEDFKNKKALRSKSEVKNLTKQYEVQYTAEKFGWYEGYLSFKRAIVSPRSGKCSYRDVDFSARLKALSVKDCYERIVEHLRERVDLRSQFPSYKGKNFSCKFIGLAKTADLVPDESYEVIESTL